MFIIAILFSVCTLRQTASGAGSIPSTLGWYQIQNTKIDSVCAGLLSQFSSILGVEGCPAIESWSGGVFDSQRNRLIVWGGGHNAYYGNEMYALDLSTLTMQRLNNPGLPLNLCSTDTAGGTQAASRHTYDGIEYMANVDRMFVFGGAPACSAGFFSVDTWTFSFATMTWKKMNPSGTIPAPNPGVVTAYDPNTGKIFLHDTLNFFSYDYPTNTWTRLSNNGTSIDYHMSATIDPVRKKFVIVGAGSVQTYSIAAGSAYARQTLNTTGGSAVVSSDYPGLEYDPVTDRIVCWNGGNTVYSLNLDNSQWTASTFSGGPGALTYNGTGTFGRWRYSPASGVFVVVNGTNKDAFAFRLSSGGGSPPPPPADTTPPTISLSVPTGGSTVSGASVTVSATASDNIGVSGVQFKVDGSNLSAEDTSSPYSVAWNTTTVPNGSHTLTVVARDAAGNQTTAATITVTVSNALSPPPSGYSIPSLTDEKNTYISWGWTWPSSIEPNYGSAPGYTVSDPDIHGDTEADDLWNYLFAYRRTAQKGYLDRANAWASYLKNGYRACVGSQYNTFCYDRDAFGLDHLWGWGLIALYEYSGDTAALAEAENIAAVVEGLYAPNSPFGCLPTNACIHYGPRQAARHLLLSTRLAEVTGKSRWIVLRDKILNLWLTSPNWDAARGMYFVGDFNTDEKVGAAAYAAGARIQSAFQIGVLAEAFTQVYRTTGNVEVKNRLIAMARFVDQYGLDPTYQYTGSWFGIVNGKAWHTYSATQPVTFWDPVYTTSLVNTLVWGYKHTGDISLYNRAKYFFNRGTKGVYGSPTQRAAADNVVHHFVDTVFASSTGNFYLEYNKGELQYTYALFEKPTAPPPDTTPPPPPTGLTAN
jgi:Big-like domain-containing protein